MMPAERIDLSHFLSRASLMGPTPCRSPRRVCCGLNRRLVPSRPLCAAMRPEPADLDKAGPRSAQGC